ncbi:MAG: methylthioribulose 1-phosphate dehydratase [Cyanobacteria bacterium REEB446]|jgi:methylthioribulose-1-phosphate dehydratase|nr:methylthioribulose 1-phosphate dehydratase [Cyanobacteria bacterium REEB446]
MNVLNLDSIKQDLIKVAHFCAVKGLVPATSGNFSARLENQEILISVSGKDKATLTEGDLMLVDFLGRAKASNLKEDDENAENGVVPPSLKPSAETLLHTQVYRTFPNAKFIAHFHSSSSAVLSKVLLKQGIKALKLEGFELLKALSGVLTHDYTEILPIFPNNQNIEELADLIQPVLEKLANSEKPLHAYLLAGHGLYTWGSTQSETIRHVDALNTLIESYLLEMQLNKVMQGKEEVVEV